MLGFWGLRVLGLGLSDYGSVVNGGSGLGLEQRIAGLQKKRFLFLGVLTWGPWDLVTNYSWAYNPTYNWVTPILSTATHQPVSPTEQ